MTRYRDRLEADHYTHTDEAEAEPEPEENGNGATKADLLEHAQSLGITPANASMSKAELQDAIDTHDAETT